MKFAAIVLTVLFALNAQAWDLPELRGQIDQYDLSATGRAVLEQTGANAVFIRVRGQMDVGQDLQLSYIREVKCLEWGDSGIRHPELDPCLQEEVLWKPQLKLSAVLHVQPEVGSSRSNISVTTMAHLSDSCLLNAEELTVVSPSRPTTIPVAPVLAENCRAYAFPDVIANSTVPQLDNAQVQAAFRMSIAIILENGVPVGVDEDRGQGVSLKGNKRGTRESLFVPHAMVILKPAQESR